MGVLAALRLIYKARCDVFEAYLPCRARVNYCGLNGRRLKACYGILLFFFFFALPLLVLLLLLLLLPLLLLWCRGNDTRSLAACISITAFLSQLAAALEPRSPARPGCKAFLGLLSAFFLWIFNLRQAHAVFFLPLPPVFVVLPSRAFTQIHCFNLLKFVDRKQKLINVCGSGAEEWKRVRGGSALCPMAQ